MDILQEIRKKTSALEGHESLEGIKAVIRHVEVAERYLIRARDDHEEDFFNDVIYRTNQAFEGMLKEAYTVLTSKDGTKLSPHQIEQLLIQEKVLASRVWELFKNYRQQWRNPSTHDHKLFFGDQEALLAIVSVSAFANILLDQIIEAINFKREQEEVQRKREQLQQSIKKYGDKHLHEQLLNLLSLFSAELKNSTFDLRQLREVEIIGRLSGFLESLDLNITIIREPQISENLSSRPDLLLKRDGEVVIVEVKRSGLSRSAIERGVYQLQAYLDAAQVEHGTLYIPPTADEEIEIGVWEFNVSGRKFKVNYVVPKHPH